MNKLTLKQKQFCKEYVNQKGNATNAYLSVYQVKNKNTASANASRLLRNANILKEIELVLQENGLNNFIVDICLLDLITQNDNLHIKIKAISEYNRTYRNSHKNISEVESENKKDISELEKSLDEQLAEFYE